MRVRFTFAIVLSGFLLFLTSCAHVSKRMPRELDRMHDFLTQDDPSECRNYHYNFERQAPRLYGHDQLDSILDVIEYIKTECGPATNLEITRLLLLADQGQFDDSLIGPSTIPQMLWYRSEREHLLRWNRWDYLYGWSQPVDNTHENFNRFTTELALRVSSGSDAAPAGQTLGQFYGGAFDSAFCRIQSDELRGAALQNSYYDFISQTKDMFPTRGNVAFLAGSWSPQGNNRLLGKHPDIGMQLGSESKWWRLDGIISYRFSSAKNQFIVDSLGQLVPTDIFNSWLFGLEGGFKFVDNSFFSTDVFVGLGYDVIFSLTEEGDPGTHVTHGSLAASLGLRQRIFLDQRKGWYVGGIVRYSFVDYGNPGGTDLSGNTLTISVVTGWSIHATLKQFLEKLNYKGSWRP